MSTRPPVQDAGWAFADDGSGLDPDPLAETDGVIFTKDIAASASRTPAAESSTR